jgi:hypothetical protein
MCFIQSESDPTNYNVHNGFRKGKNIMLPYHLRNIAFFQALHLGHPSIHPRQGVVMSCKETQTLIALNEMFHSHPANSSNHNQVLGQPVYLDKQKISFPSTYLDKQKITFP